jgi:hypothetical protein
MTDALARLDEALRRAPTSPYWCEENAWQRCDLARLGDAPAWVWFLTNARRMVAVAHQRLGHGDLQAVVWDYHVVVCVGRPWRVFDPDSTLEHPCEAATWIRASLRPFSGDPRVAARIAVIAAADFRAGFSSDRRHMLDAAGQWRRPPPTWPPILAGETSDLSLPRLMAMRGTLDWIDANALERRFAAS